MADPAAEYLDTLEEPRRGEVARLHALVTEALPELPVSASAAGLGYGPFHYRYASGREGDSHLISLASRKQYMSLYVNCAPGGRYLAEDFAPRLPSADVGRSCVRFKSVADLDEAVIRELVRAAAAAGPADAA